VTEQHELDAAWAAVAEREDPEAIDLLVREYASLARYLARRAAAKAPAYQDADDLLSYAHGGLLDSIRLFEPAVGVKFETYATRRISGAIIDGQRRQDPLARGTRRMVKAMAASVQVFWDVHHREPKLAELAEAMGESEESVRDLQLAQLSLNASLDAIADDGHDTPGSGAGAEVSTQLTEARRRVALKLAAMSAGQRAFVLTHYVDQETLRATAQRLRISNVVCRDTRRAVLERLTA
jgi:RNA polymerase sigma factor for flagellar operon FliA